MIIPPKVLGRFLLLMLAVASGPATLADEDRPNILFIAIDDFKPLAGVYGSNDVLTPNIDGLASRSLVFERAYAQYPVCGPSRTSLLTGMRPEVNGVMDLKTRMRSVYPNILTLPQHFKNKGYETAAVGKIFDPRNVDSRKDDDPASWSIPFRPVRGGVDRKNIGKLAVRAIDAPANQFVDGQINERGIKLLNEMAGSDKPFFLAVGFKKPHLPFIVPAEYFDLYDRNLLGLAGFPAAPQFSNPDYIMNNNGELRTYAPTPGAGQKAERYSEGLLPTYQQRELLHGYYASVSFIDHLIGELLKTLEETGKADNTIIVLWGDHGFHLGDHGLWGKHTTMEQATRVPLILHQPGSGQGIISDPVELLDLFPTLTEMAGLEMPDGLQGDSLVTYLNDPEVSQNGVAISQYKRKGSYGYSMRTDRYRYTEWVNAKGLTVYRDLYDLETDPEETINIADVKCNRQLLAALAAQLRENGAGLLRLDSQ